MTDLTTLILKTLDDHKALDVTVLDIRTLTDIADTFIIASASSNRHARTLGDKVAREMKTAGNAPCYVSGEDVGEWVILDFIDVVVHIMLPAARDLYQLEELWSSTQKHRQ